jgi:hypothetical protein
VLDRLRESGFSVERFDTTSISGDAELLAVKDEAVFVCRHPGAESIA